MLLDDAYLSTPYIIRTIHLPKESVSHLSHLGMRQGETVRLLAKTKEGAIVMLKGSRLAFDQSILQKVEVVRADEDEAKSIPLSDLPLDTYAYIEDIFAQKDVKRRLMDMGLTRHTKVYLRKVAPLGDPIELSLRGYELTLRKSEAASISVVPIKEEGK
ncbi:FeoA domain-containing protein [Streptococcus sp. zg-JUN1979]|uniref:FeoA domain-containing protein n=1 Tax=Streptococcus sp. zg-JUN1979 TaxID=3391450 RepID=UPI0039A416BC